MCGIAGVVGGHSAEAVSAVDAALRTLTHRGPDGHEYKVDGACVLGQTRLAIIDLSPAGQEPFPNEDETAWLTFNGEIYNFRDLRLELEAEGHRFRSRTDAEVVLHAYEQWGDSCLERLRGMFAFAIWDSRRKRLFMARDRVGKKPLFYAKRDGRFMFASELQGLLAMLGSSPAVDPEAIAAYLSWGYVPAPLTGFEGIFKLSPGHSMTVESEDGTIRTAVERYWELDYLPKSDLDLDEACRRLRELMTEAVELRLISDVPLGAFLSGGIDSSIVVGLMAQLSSGPVKTFSIGFSDEDYSELAHARRIAELWGTDHQEFVVEPDAIDILPLLVRHYGEPYADSSAIPTYYVSKMTSEHVTVALNGDGGDESFAGYERYWANAQAERVASVPGARAAAEMLSRVLPDSSNPKSKLRKVRRFLGVAGQPQSERYARWSSYFTEEERSRLLLPDVRHQVGGLSRRWFGGLFDGTEHLDAADAAMSVDVRSYLPFDLLVKVDITSMANSLECRSPFLDHHVMEFAARLPVKMKLKGNVKKYILRKAFSDLLPKENVQRPKMGFGVPVGRWLRGPLRELLGDTLLTDSMRLSSYLDTREVRSTVDAHLSGQERSAQVWNLLMLEMWLREVVSPQPAGRT
ncbi:MAG: asparagine synthase (glutamine-hydrolyzing) [Actinobacteria bacterium]|nr:asparagine synthase (glutamine-hydrolyzing) [Actinomycetota bacterium]